MQFSETRGAETFVHRCFFLENRKKEAGEQHSQMLMGRQIVSCFRISRSVMSCVPCWS